MKNPNKRQADSAPSFKQTARELGCDESEARFEANLKKVAAHKPLPDAKLAKPKKSK